MAPLVSSSLTRTSPKTFRTFAECLTFYYYFFFDCCKIHPLPLVDSFVRIENHSYKPNRIQSFSCAAALQKCSAVLFLQPRGEGNMQAEPELTYELDEVRYTLYLTSMDLSLLVSPAQGDP